MSRFINDSPSILKISGSDWIKVKKLSYEEFIGLMPSQEEKDIKVMSRKNIEFLKAVIVEWNFADDSGKEVPCTKENIENLDVKTVNEIAPLVIAQYGPEKKSELPSTKQ